MGVVYLPLVGFDSSEPRQSRIVDISRYWRTGGIDWPRLKENFDGVVICAGIGMRMDVLLPEHTDKANEVGVPLNTYHIPDPLQNMKEQAHWYTEQYKVTENRAWFDNEKPYLASREATMAEADYYVSSLDSYHPLQCGEYSRWDILIRQGLSPRLKTHKLWIAHYLYDLERYAAGLVPLTYLRYEPFFEQRAWKLPPYTPDEYKDSVIGWQITSTGDARFYCANEKTDDPVYIYGMTNADLNVSVIPHTEFMPFFSPNIVVEPEEPGTVCSVLSIISDVIQGLKVKFGC